MSVRYTLLGLLAHHPRHGYELHAAFEAVMGGEENWDVKPAQIYSTLARLQESGHIVEELDGTDGESADRRVYAITEKGQSDLADWFNTPVAREHQRDEVFAKLMLAIVTEVVKPRQVLQIQRSRLYQDLHALTAQRSKVDPKTDLAHILLLDSAVMHIEADLRWLDMVEARIDEIKRQPLPEPEMRPRGRPKKTSNA
ncbi:MAG TPA: PadR family transcriptional regulator [Anaerolineae bacterium]|nr:PadR family transcriptional regulator [Anaerolineae bacterium]